VNRDIHEAVRWYRTAAEKGEAKAQANLGLLYYDGNGVTSDFVQAYKWFRLSAMQGDAVGRRYVEDYQENHRLTASQLAEAERMISGFQARVPEKRPAKAD